MVLKQELTSPTILLSDVAVVSGALIFIKDDLKINDTEIEVLAGIINLYSLLGSLAAGRTSDRIGRRYAIVVVAAFFFAGALTMGLASGYAVLMLGRFVTGIGVGFALAVVPVYAAEIAPASSRGFLSSLPEVFGNFGVLLGFVSNFAFAKLPGHLSWRVMFLAGAVPPVFLSAGVLAMPKSPRWLVMQGRTAEAEAVLARTSDSPEEAGHRLADIRKAVGAPGGRGGDVDPVPGRNRGEGVWKELLVSPTPAVRRVLLAAVGLHFFQQASGIDSVVLYSPRVFEKAGLRRKDQLLGATIAVGFAKTSFILVAAFLLDRVGRRPLLLSSAGGMVVSLLLLASGLRAIDRTPDGEEASAWAVALCIGTVLSFVGAFSVGLGPIAWVYGSEIFPTRLRAQGASLGAATNRVASGVVTMTFLSLCKAITTSGSFFLYAGVAAAGWVFFYAFLPETKGRRLEDIGELFGNGEGENKSGGEVDMAGGARTDPET
ncbi:sorbitol transporter [Iris pallida]|uniref:Sorbitol transporter n=1 Tax=Iris pallida TaxID=29817 RepID=A0AAX6HQZ0_IRIPA|nr:sorbitol transporter [Iris pallida]